MENTKDIVAEVLPASLSDDKMLENESNPDISYVEEKNIYYSTGKVAELLGISRDMVRIHIKDFEKYLDVTYTSSSAKGKHVRLSSSDVKTLESIVHLRKSKSVEETKHILDDPALSLLHLDEHGVERALALVLTKSNEALVETFSKMMKELQSHSTALLLEQKENSDKEISQLQSELAALKSDMQRQTELLELLAQRTEKKKRWPFH